MFIFILLFTSWFSMFIAWLLDFHGPWHFFSAAVLFWCLGFLSGRLWYERS